MSSSADSYVRIHFDSLVAESSRIAVKSWNTDDSELRLVFATAAKNYSAIVSVSGTVTPSETVCGMFVDCSPKIMADSGWNIIHAV